SFVFFTLSRTLHAYSLLGVSSEAIRKAQLHNKTGDGKTIPLVWRQKANLDNPSKRIYARRWIARLFMSLVSALFGLTALAYLLLVFACFIINDKVTLELWFSENRFYPAFWLAGSLVAGGIV
ncbi:hypothetical protein KKJ06_22825, partial [Xenorhabdus bovienii]